MFCICDVVPLVALIARGPLLHFFADRCLTSSLQSEGELLYFLTLMWVSHVARDKSCQLRDDKYRIRVVCAGVAAELKLKCSGRRNMLGAVLGRRRCAWIH